MREKEGSMELDLGQLKAFASTFISRTDLYAQQTTSGRYACIRKPLSLDLVESHLRGELTLGAYALSPESQASWICLDADDEPEWVRILTMARSLQTQGVPLYLEPSRRGGHLWLFTPPLPGSQVRLLGKQLQTEFDLEAVELFPKQERLISGPGSLVRLPLGIHRKSSRRYHFITPEGGALSSTIRSQVGILGRPERLPEAFIQEVLSRAEKASPLSPTASFEPRPAAPGERLSDRIKNSISVGSFVSQYVALDENGTGLCPFHDDKHRSFGVNEAGNYWNCWAGCGGGSVIDFWMKWRERQGQRADFVETLKELADMLLAD